MASSNATSRSVSASLNAPVRGHAHSKSASGLGHAHPEAISASSLTADPTKYSRASLDGPRSVSQGTAQNGGPRPASEMLTTNHFTTPENEAIDRWFEDLQHYEATLDEMAAASLDHNFKEELSAIEQWFHVLSSPERTAALYALLQSCNSVQIRFFITVLQQLARQDPDNPLLSPGNPASASMQDQMDTKLAAMGFKGPSSPAPGGKFGRQLLGPGSATAENFLSPKSARGDENAAALLAQQRAKLKASAHRISAPGTLTASASELKSPLWSQSEAVAERRSPSPSGQRPKSTGSATSAASGEAAPLRSPFASIEEQLSPMLNNWSSMVNTPLVPMFTDTAAAAHTDQPTSPNLDLSNANNKLAGWTQQQQIVLDDAKKFRRSGRMPENLGVSGGPSSLNASLNTSVNGNRRHAPTQRAASGPQSLPQTGTFPQQAALSAQANWRNINGLLSPQLGTAGANMSPADMANALLQQQQMMQAQLQLQQNLMMNGMVMNGLMSPNMNLMNMGALSPALSSAGSAKRSPRPGGSSFGQRTPNLTQGSGANPDEVVDDALLNDIPAWLRSLRLHKYTPNFENDKWQDIVQLTDAGLEAKGVSALGARRKLLKVFENVRVAKGMQEKPANDEGAQDSQPEDAEGSRSPPK